MKGPALFRAEIITEEQKYIDKYKNLSLQKHWVSFNQTWHKAFLSEGYISLFKQRATLFSKGRL